MHRFFDRFFHRFCLRFFSFFIQKSTKILPKIDSKMHYIFDRFFHRFFFDLSSILEANLELCWPPWGHLGGSWRLGRRLGPTLVVLVRLKIDAKIDRKSDASWNRFLEGFWWIFGGKMEACWHQNLAKIDANFEERFFEKSYSRCSGGSIFQDLGVQVGKKKRTNIDQNI